MIIKQAVYAKKRRTVNVRISDEVNGCDCCKRKIPKDGKELTMIVFPAEDKEGERLNFCSWKCLLKYLPRIKSTYFASFPFLHFDGSGSKGCNAKDLLDLLKPKRSR